MDMEMSEWLVLIGHYDTQKVEAEPLAIGCRIEDMSDANGTAHGRFVVVSRLV